MLYTGGCWEERKRGDYLAFLNEIFSPVAGGAGIFFREMAGKKKTAGSCGRPSRSVSKCCWFGISYLVQKEKRREFTDGLTSNWEATVRS